MVDRISNNFFDTTRNTSRSSALDTKPDQQLVNKFDKNLLTDGGMDNNEFVVSSQIITKEALYPLPLGRGYKAIGGTPIKVVYPVAQYIV